MVVVNALTYCCCIRYHPRVLEDMFVLYEHALFIEVHIRFIHRSFGMLNAGNFCLDVLNVMIKVGLVSSLLLPFSLCLLHSELFQFYGGM